MKNKKLLNLYYLALSLLALITFILPFEKVNPAGIGYLGVNIVSIVASVLMVISLVVIVFISIVNLFTDQYDAVKYCVSFALFAFVMVAINTILYASILNVAFGWGSILLCVEVFALFTFNQFVKMVFGMKEFPHYVCSFFPKRESKPAVVLEKKESVKKPKTVISAKKEKVDDTKPEFSDNKPEKEEKEEKVDKPE